jgi:hypothetical protein
LPEGDREADRLEAGLGRVRPLGRGT